VNKTFLQLKEHLHAMVPTAKYLERLIFVLSFERGAILLPVGYNILYDLLVGGADFI
jgi:hypothetical protein